MKIHKTFLVTAFIFCSLWTVINCACIHDQIKARNPPRKQLIYEDNNEHTITKRSGGIHRGPRPGFRKIRIHCDFRGLDPRIDQTQRDLVRSILNNGVTRVTNIFTVRPVVGNLVLPRSSQACTREWENGPNAGKCSKIRSTYTGEECLEGLDVIPQDHVEGLSEWGFSSLSYVKFEDGEGIPNTDFVLYIRSTATEMCANNLNVMAYATYCHQDQDGRPISGMVNLCPSLLTRTDVNIDTKRMTVMHEIFHALGFSSDLFEQFRDCSGGTCRRYRDPVHTVDSVPRLVTPYAVEATTKHFKCFDAGREREFGPILQREGSNIKSHWDAAFMYSSIMAPTVELGHLTVVDPITLAVFEDSGWYGIDYYYADFYEWGRGGGCDFAIKGSCDSDRGSKFFCEGSRIGCHYLHQDKGQCKSDPFLIDCRVYKASLKDTCKMNYRDESLPGEIFQSDSKCFMSNIKYRGQGTSVQLDGRCFRHRCMPGKRQEVQLDSSSWHSCPSGQRIQIPGFEGVVECPDIKILCRPPKPPRPSYPNEGHMPPPMRPGDPGERTSAPLGIEIMFRYEFRDLWRNNLLDLFKKEVFNEIKKRTHCSEGRISKVDVFDSDQLVTSYRFYLSPSKDMMDGPNSNMVYNVLDAHISARNFTVFLPEPVSALSIRTVPLDPTESKKGMEPGIIAGIVVVLVVIAVAIGVMVFFVQRYYALQDRLRQAEANYPPPRYNDLSENERRDSNPSIQSRSDGSYSDLASYHSDIESYPVSKGQYASKRASIDSELGGVDNLAYNCESKESVTSSNSTTPSVTYVSTVSVKGEDKNSAEKSAILNNNNSAQELENDKNPERKISCNSDSDVPSRDVYSNGLMNRVSDMCNEPVPHHEDDEYTVTTIGIRDRTSSEITISTIHARKKLEERKRVKSQDDVNIKPASHSNSIVPFHKTRFPFTHSNNRDSVVTISTVSSRDRSMSDVTISSLSKNSVYMGSNAHIPNGNGEINRAFVRDHSVSNENRFSNNTLSTVLSGDRSVSEDENDAVFIKSRPTRKGSHCDVNKHGVETSGAGDLKSKILDRTGSVQSKNSEISCNHNHENHRKKTSAANANRITSRLHNTSSSSECSLSSNACSECDSCPYCRDCASVISDESETNHKGNSARFVSIVNTDKYNFKK